MASDFEKERQKALRQKAIAAGNEALTKLRRAQNQLETARGWGVLDMLGGGIITSMTKHDKMNDAEGYISDARKSLRAFDKELKELQNLNDLQNINLDTRDFIGMTDLLFDNLGSDIAMQRRILDAHQKIQRAINKVSDIMRKL